MPRINPQDGTSESLYKWPNYSKLDSYFHFSALQWFQFLIPSWVQGRIFSDLCSPTRTQIETKPSVMCLVGEKLRWDLCTHSTYGLQSIITLFLAYCMYIGWIWLKFCPLGGNPKVLHQANTVGIEGHRGQAVLISVCWSGRILIENDTVPIGQFWIPFISWSYSFHGSCSFRT